MPSNLRAAAVVLLLSFPACTKPDAASADPRPPRPPRPPSASPPASASATAPASASLAPSALAPPAATAGTAPSGMAMPDPVDGPGTPIAAAKPLTLRRQWQVGKTYLLHLERLGGGRLLVLDGSAKVDSATATAATFSLAIDKATFAGQPPRRGALKVTADYARRRPSIDAEQTDGDSLSLHLTEIEHLFGDLCPLPSAPHRPGDTWEDEAKRTFTLTSYERAGGFDSLSFHSEEKSPALSIVADARLRVTDGVTGTCRAVHKLTAHGMNETQERTLVVRPAP